ncbi:MAG: metal ABC transporter solute-binding protein, Zn/Mn family [Cyanobium sp.]
MGPARSSLLLGLAALLVACGSPGKKPEAQGRGPQGESLGRARPGLQVVTTFLPITLLTRAVAGECAQVRALVPPAVGPHDFQARPGDLLALQEARVLVKNGLGVEAFLDPLIRAAANPQLRVVDSSRGVATLQDHADAPDPHGEGHSHSHGAVNPHIWLDPLRAAQQVETIRAALAAADPGCAEGYGRRAIATTAKLQELHRTLALKLKPYQGKAFVSFHAVAPYFAERYGLKAVALVDVPEMNPTPADLQRVTAVVKANGIRALLREPQAEGPSFQALAKDLGLGIGTFDPLETGSEEASRDPATYVDTMARNGAQLVKAFGGSAGRSNAGTR